MIAPRPISLVLLLAALLAPCSLAAADEPPDGIDRIRVPAAGGRVAYADLAAALARAEGLEFDAALAAIPPEGLRLDSTAATLALTALNVALQPAVRCRVVQAEQGGRELEVAIDRRALRAAQADLRAAAAGLLDRSGRRQKVPYGLSPEPGAADAPLDRPLVVLLHGFNSTPERAARLLDVPHELHLPCATFAYPNDQPIADSARLLSRELRRLYGEQPGRQVVLLTHSMGGLVARAAIEQPRLDPRCIVRLVMVAPPSQGAAFARYAVGLDVWEHLLRRRGADWKDRLYGAVADGFNEAAADLRPGSRFLQQLNHRPRNPRVAYTIFLGDGGQLDAAPLAAVEAVRAVAADEHPWARKLAGQLDAVERDLADAIERGDGVVPLASGRLDGVDDTVVLGFSHFSVLDRPDHPATVALDRELRQRLSEAR